MFSIKTWQLLVFSDLWSFLPLASGMSTLIHLLILWNELQYITHIWGPTTIKQKRHRQYFHLYILISCYYGEASHTGELFKVFDWPLVLISIFLCSWLLIIKLYVYFIEFSSCLFRHIPQFFNNIQNSMLREKTKEKKNSTRKFCTTLVFWDCFV